MDSCDKLGGMILPLMRSATSTVGSPLRVRLREVTRQFDGRPALESIDLEIHAGEFTALLGPSGCGKTTLLRLIAGLDRPTTGRVTLDEVGSTAPSTDRGDIPRNISYVFQEPHLMPWRNVLENVALPLELRGTSRTDRRESAMRAVERVGLADAADRYPAQLSGGMRMRASLARALVTSPGLLLLDEPFAALDEITRQALEADLRALWRERRMTVLFVTHSIQEAAFLSQRAIVLSRRPGRIVLNRQLDLPEDRPPEIRTGDAFQREMRQLFEALRSGGG